MNKIAGVVLTLVIVAASCVGGYELWNYYLFSPWTRDARVQADVVSIAPDVAGFVDDLRVKDNQFVHKGDVLLVIDWERYTRALAMADATVAARKADMENAAQQAVADRSTAQLNSRPHHLARAGQRDCHQPDPRCRSIRRGRHQTHGLDRQRSYRVTGYFEETKMPAVKTGQQAEIYLLDGSPALRGHVESIARGITDRDNLAGPELLVNPNPTFEWVRLAQRIPVRIHIDDVPKGVLVSSGVTATVVVEAPPRRWAILAALRRWQAALQ